MENQTGRLTMTVSTSIIEAAERDGRPARRHVVEATAGNIKLASPWWRRKGYRLVLVIPDKMSAEKICHLRALGAEVRPPDVPKAIRNIIRTWPPRSSPRRLAPLGQPV